MNKALIIVIVIIIIIITMIIKLWLSAKRYLNEINKMELTKID